jgi:hypothetical protein
MKINKVEDSLSGVETFDQWKEKASELESSVSEVEGKFKPEKDIKKDYGQIQAVFSNIQVRDSTPQRCPLFLSTYLSTNLTSVFLY